MDKSFIGRYIKIIKLKLKFLSKIYIGNTKQYLLVVTLKGIKIKLKILPKFYNETTHEINFKL